LTKIVNRDSLDALRARRIFKKGADVPLM